MGVIRDGRHSTVSCLVYVTDPLLWCQLPRELFCCSALCPLPPCSLTHQVHIWKPQSWSHGLTGVWSQVQLFAAARCAW